MTKLFKTEEFLLRIKNLLTNVQNRRYVEANPKSKIEPEKPKPKTVAVPNYQPTKEDIDWLKEVEIIALREIQNKHFVMEDLAKELLLGQRTMHRKIKQITGLTPNRYIRSIRLHRAKLILETQKASTLKEVAFAVGFDGVTHFNKLFETEFGKYPQAYLQSQKI